MRNLAFKVVGDVIMSVYTDMPPSDDEATAILNEMRKMDLARAKALIHTKGGAPTVAQRKRVYQLLGSRDLPAAIISDSWFVRGVSTAMSWFNKGHRVFSPDEVVDALEFIGIPSTQFDFFQRELEKLQQELQR